MAGVINALDLIGILRDDATIHNQRGAGTSQRIGFVLLKRELRTVAAPFFRTLGLAEIARISRATSSRRIGAVSLWQEALLSHRGIGLELVETRARGN